MVTIASLMLAAALDADVTRVVTLQEAVAAADAAPELEAARASERAADASIKLARRLPDPTLSFTTNSVTAREALAAALPLPWPARGRRIDAARAELASAGRGRESARASTRRQLRAAWFALASAEDRARAVADRQLRAQRNAEAVDALFQQGRVARLDQVRAEAEAALALSERAAADEARDTAAAVLAALMHLETSAPLGTGEARPMPEPEGELEACVSRAREASPDVRVQAAEVDAASARWQVARKLQVPAFELNLGVDWNDPTAPGTNKAIGLSFNVPLTGGASSAVAEAERDRQMALLAREKRDAGAAAEAAWRATRAARLRYEAIDGRLLPAAREGAQLARLAYREGKADVFRLLEAERLLSDAELARADAYEAWGVAGADRLRATDEAER